MKMGELPGGGPYPPDDSREVRAPGFDPRLGTEIHQFDFGTSDNEQRDPQPHERSPPGPSGPPIANALGDILSIQEYERKRLGQELHDATGQLLVALQFGVSHLRKIAEDSGQGPLIAEIGETVRQIDQQIRNLAFLEYPAELGDRDLGSAIQLLALGFGRRTGVRTSFKGIGDGAALDVQTSMAMLRIAQEALVNVHRHARAEAVKVSLKIGPERVQLTISDDGVGFVDVRGASEGLGLRGMRHRVESLGGLFRTTNLRRGAKVSAIVPLGRGRSASPDRPLRLRPGSAGF